MCSEARRTHLALVTHDPLLVVTLGLLLRPIAFLLTGLLTVLLTPLLALLVARSAFTSLDPSSVFGTVFLRLLK